MKPIKLQIEVESHKYGGPQPEPITWAVDCEVESIREIVTSYSSESILPDPEKGFKQDSTRGALAVFRIVARRVAGFRPKKKEDWLEEFLDDPAREWVAVSVGQAVFAQFSQDRSRVA